jgi:hypothetical protein
MVTKIQPPHKFDHQTKFDKKRKKNVKMIIFTILIALFTLNMGGQGHNPKNKCKKILDHQDGYRKSND